ncbi:MAG: hypothetical protein NT039_03775 [Candidatus Berkelbacteria bacterium]|nr:hypothetical protein [Candidatus Berkelbacteria bacterium]
MSELLQAVGILIGCIAGWKLLELLDKRVSQRNTTQPTLQAAEAHARALEQTALALATAIGTHGSLEMKRRAKLNVTGAFFSLAPEVVPTEEFLTGLRTLDEPENRRSTSLLNLAEYTLSV